jgi:hypothetical protein
VADPNIFSLGGKVAGSQFAVHTSGTEKVRVTAAGNMGIGTTSPGQRLTVAGMVESTSGGFKFPDGSTQASAVANTAADITAVTAGTGLSGGGTSGDVSLSLLTSCSAGQLLKWNGSAWACDADLTGGGGGSGTVTSVAAGTGLVASPSPITTTGTLGINTGVVPLLAAENVFTTRQRFGETLPLVIERSCCDTAIQFNAVEASGGHTFVSPGPAASISVFGGDMFFHFAPSGNPGDIAQFVGRFSIMNKGNVGIGVVFPGPRNLVQIGGNISDQGLAGLDAQLLMLNGTLKAATSSGFYPSGLTVTPTYDLTNTKATLLRGIYVDTNTRVSSNSANTVASISAAQPTFGDCRAAIAVDIPQGVPSLCSGSYGFYQGGAAQFNYFTANTGFGAVVNPSNVITVKQASATDPIADAWTVYSSRRWKKNVRTLQNALQKVERLRGVSYDDLADGKHEVGLIAEEVGEVVPEVVAYEENGKDAQGLDYSRLTALLVEAVKEQQAEIRELRSELAARARQQQQLAAEIETLKASANDAPRTQTAILASER